MTHLNYYHGVLRNTALKASIEGFLSTLQHFPIEVSILLNGDLSDHFRVDGTFVPPAIGDFYMTRICVESPVPTFVSIISKHTE